MASPSGRVSLDMLRLSRINDRGNIADAVVDRHARGAALTAQRWGALKSVPNGRAGQTYAIPTKPHDVRARLTLEEIAIYVRQFIMHAKANTDNVFLVTAIGCGLAGYKAKDIAPMFAECVEMVNVKLPLNFWLVLIHR